MEKQKEILQFLATVETATIDDVMLNISWSYYANGKQHVCAIISRMIRNKSVIRVKKGVYGLNRHCDGTPKHNQLIVVENQTNLFYAN